MAKITVEYEIPDDGDCTKCGLFSYPDDMNNGMCNYFNQDINDYTSCQACKDYLKEKSNEAKV